MIDAGTRLSLEEFQAEFRTAWAALRWRFLKVEVWQSYQELDAAGSQQAFQRGDLDRARSLLQDEAEHDRPLYENIQRRGLDYARIRLVTEPWSAYLRYELMAYQIRARMGENILVVRADPDASLPHADVFDLLLFDRDVALVHDYGTAGVGHQTGGWLVRDPQAIEDLERRALALRAKAVPLDRYLSRHGARGNVGALEWIKVAVEGFAGGDRGQRRAGRRPSAARARHGAPDGTGRFGPFRQPPFQGGPMSPPRTVRTMIVAAAATLATVLAGSAAAAATDRTPPSTPFIGYSQGFQCLTVILGVNRSTDDVTPSSQLTYEAVADGVHIGTLTDKPHSTGAWGVLQLPHAGSNTVTVRAVDAAGNRSAVSNARVVRGYFTPGCTPWKIGG